MKRDLFVLETSNPETAARVRALLEQLKEPGTQWFQGEVYSKDGVLLGILAALEAANGQGPVN